MIVLVDDDEIILEVSSAALVEAGWEVTTFDSALAALEFLQETDPELIVSDLMMPEMDGFGFRQAYLERFPGRSTPFLFLSSMSDPDIIIEGLDRGADDYLLKPIDDRVFAAKVKTILKRRGRTDQVFHGDLAQLPLNRVMKFCELKGINGSVEISGGGVTATLKCSRGNFEIAGEGAAADLEQVLSLESGRFTIRIEPVDYTELTGAAPVARPSAGSQEVPMGVLSGVKLNNRLFQLQSEFVEPSQQIVTLVILDGKVRLKRVAEAPLELGRARLQQMLEEQHVAVEKEVQEKVSKIIEEKSGSEPTQRERFNSLFEEGLSFYREAEYEKALACWEEASTLNPSDKLIITNLNIVRKKLEGLNVK